jgi:hypothetical protein
MADQQADGQQQKRHNQRPPDHERERVPDDAGMTR